MSASTKNVKSPFHAKINLRQTAGLIRFLSPAVFALAIVITAKLALNLPRPLILFVAGTYLLCSLMFLPLLFRGKMTTGRWMLAVIGIWLTITALLLGALYKLDKGGWNWYKVTGYNITPAENLQDQMRLSNSEFLSRNPSFTASAKDPSILVLKKGTHEINKTVAIPPGDLLVIEPGSILRFGAGASLISYRPILARGTAAEPIVFTARHTWRKWGVFGVVSAAKSVFEYAKFEHGRQALVNDLNFPGCLSLLGSEVEIAHCEFSNLYGKDAIYINKGRVLIINNTVHSTFKDGLDLDGGLGLVSQNQFVNCGDEGIDLSDNHGLQVIGNEILDARGGRVAADYDLDSIKSANNLAFYRGE